MDEFEGRVPSDFDKMPMNKNQSFDDIPHKDSYSSVDSASNFMVPRADLRPEIFDAAIDQKGYRVIWQKGMFCSCYVPDSGQPDYNCPHCRGKGYQYFDSNIIKVLITSINGRKEQDKPGLIETGTAYLTPKSSDRVGFRDRFTFLDFNIRYSEVIRHGESGNGDLLRYPSIDVVKVVKDGDEFIEGVDFSFNEDKTRILWNEGTIQAKDAYSILYYINPVYIALNPIHELRGTYTLQKGGGVNRFAKLPDQFQIKREDFIDPHSRRGGAYDVGY